MQRGQISTKSLFSVLPNAEACFSDTDLDIDIITVPDQGESGTTLNTSTGSNLLSAARQKNDKSILLSPKYKQYSEKIGEWKDTFIIKNKVQIMAVGESKMDCSYPDSQ